MSIDLDTYNTVPERIAEFAEKYPENSLQRVGDLQFVSFAGADWVIYTAAAYRTPDDPRPGMGTAWERIPGTTQFTKGSEVQNAETSAWGRAIIAVHAADSRKGIASREEVDLAIARQDAIPARDWVEEARALGTAEQVLNLWREAKKKLAELRMPKEATLAILDKIAAIGAELRAIEEESVAPKLVEDSSITEAPKSRRATSSTVAAVPPVEATDPNDGDSLAWPVATIPRATPTGDDAA